MSSSGVPSNRADICPMVFAPLKGEGFAVELLVWLGVFGFLMYMSLCTFFFLKRQSQGDALCIWKEKQWCFVKVSVCLSFSKT